MAVFIIKQLLSLRQAIVGRNEPHQLAWGLALGALLGIVPHGNLLAVALLLVVLSFRINHAMAAISAVSCSFLAPHLDGYSHLVGRFVLTHPDWSRHWVTAWQWPLVPWTDLNNTIVMGSLVLGLSAVVPMYLVSYPIFHWFGPSPSDTPIDPPPAAANVAEQPVFVPIDPVTAPLAGSIAPTAVEAAIADVAELRAASNAEIPRVVDRESGAATPMDRRGEPIAIETRIDVIRMNDHRRSAQGGGEIAAADITDKDEAMSQALNYLLRQLRDSRTRNAA